MKPEPTCPCSPLRTILIVSALVLFVLVSPPVPCHAQQTVGAITGTVLDTSGASVQDAEVKARNIATNFEVTAHSKSNGSYSIPNLPIGTYELKFTKQGFETETHTEVLVSSDRTTTVDAALKVGAVSTTVEVSAVALMNQTDATNGYVVDQATIQETPLGTGSFTQLAILAPGVHADFLQGGGSNAGLGNQAIWANGNRDTSNSFSLNGVSTNNLFNGNSTSSVGENRFTFNIGESFGAGGALQTNTSVYGAIGQALPTPPPDAIQEIAVNAAMYDATQGNTSGAHISVVTKSGTNTMHGSAWEQWQNSVMNAAPFFYNAVNLANPFMNRNQFGATLGGPIKKDKVFYFLSYQGVRISDASDSTKDVVVPLGLTDDRSPGGIAAAMNSTYGITSFTPGMINSVAQNLLQAKLPNGQFLIPTPNPSISYTTLGYDAIVQGPNTNASVDQGTAGLDIALTEKDRLSGKYYIQNDPSTSPIGAAGVLLGFPQTLEAGSQVFSIANTFIVSPNLTWEQHAGFTRMFAYANTTQDFTPNQIGMNLLGATKFPQIEISTSDPTIGGDVLQFGPSTSFGDAGMYQNQWEAESQINWVKGRNTIAIGGQWDHTQLNILNNNTGTDIVEFKTFESFVEGSVRTGDAFTGTASRYYRSDTAGVYINDNFKLRSNLTLTGGVRWDYDGPLSEKYGRLTGFDASKYSYDVSADTITSSGLEIAGNNANATPGASNSLMQNNQWGFAPRVGIAWTPTPKLTVRAGYGMYYDRGELFSYFSAGAGSGFNGPFGVTMSPPFVEPIAAAEGASASAPFGTVAPPPPVASAANYLAELPNFSQTACGNPGCWPAGNLFGPYTFAGYDIHNKLPYTENWTLDLQYQLSNDWLFEIGYVGNHGQHEVLPIPFNEPRLATPAHPLWTQNPANQQIYSYGGATCYESFSGQQPCQYPDCCDLEPISTNEYSGNAPLRVPYIGYDMNSVTYNAEGISNYNALQLQVRKRFSHGLQFTAAYTYSHTLDEQSGLGLFVTGNNALTPKANYGSADFDQTHVLLVNYSYTIPSFARDNKALGYAVNGWTIGGMTVAESGQPYSVYDYSGDVGSLYFGSDVYIENPIVPLAKGVTAKQAQLQGTTGVNAGQPVLNVNDFYPQFVAPGTDGVPPCDASGCDVFESAFSTTGRNMFRGPFQTRFDLSLAKQFPIIKDRFDLRFEADAFNISNTPDFDAPNNNAFYFEGYEAPPYLPGVGQYGLGSVEHTIGSSRFFMLKLHLLF